MQSQREKIPCSACTAAHCRAICWQDRPNRREWTDDYVRAVPEERPTRERVATDPLQPGAGMKLTCAAITRQPAGVRIQV